MRYLTGAILAGFLASCGGSSEPTPPPPPPPASTPATIAIHSGDGQLADPGKAVITAPTVIVKDASGRPVGGTSVTFTVAAGGGHVGAASVATGTDGTATTTWTLGPTEGADTLVATVGSLTPVKFHAMARFALKTVIDTTSVPAGGGELTFSAAGDSLAGVRLTVFGQTFAGPARFYVAQDRATTIPLPADVKLVNVFEVATDSAFGSRPMALRIPARVGHDSMVAAFFYDPASGALESVPLVGRDDSTITVASHHFRADQMFKTAKAPSLRRGFALHAPTPAFGGIKLITTAASRQSLTATATTTFVPGVDDWEFTNYGTFVEPDGICAGMSISAMYYFYNSKATGGGLNHRYDTFSNVEFDNPQGEATATFVQHILNWTSETSYLQQIQTYAGRKGLTYDQLVYESTVLSLKVTGQPQLLALTGDSGAHAVVAYAAGNGKISFADPNFPGVTTRVMTFDPGTELFDPVQSSENASSGMSTYTKIDLAAVSASVRTTALARAFGWLAKGQAADSVFPALRYEYFDQVQSDWVPIPAGDTVTTTHRILALRTVCTGPCTRRRPSSPSKQVTTGIRDSLDALLGNDAVDTDSAAVFVFGRGPGSFRVLLETFNDAHGSPTLLSSYLGAKLITIMAPAVTIDPNPAKGEPGIDLNFTASTTGFAPTELPTLQYVWNFGDGTPEVVKVGDSTIVHQWTDTGTFPLTVELRDGRGHALSNDEVDVVIEPKATYVWVFQSASIQSVSMPAGGIGPEKLDTAIFKIADGWTTELESNPSASGILLYGKAVAGASCNAAAALERFPQGQWVDTVGVLDIRGLIGVCGDPDYAGGLVMGALGNGTLIGSATATPPPDTIELPGGSIDAVMAGKSLSGTFTVKFEYSTGISIYTIGFTATRVKP